jgi:hypothetical protein
LYTLGFGQIFKGILGSAVKKRLKNTALDHVYSP